MSERGVEVILQRAREMFPEARPRIISDNGPQFIARDSKEFIRLRGMTHVRTSPYYPQSNGKIERLNQTLKATAIRSQTPLTIEDARRTVARFVADYNNSRLHSAIGYAAAAGETRRTRAANFPSARGEVGSGASRAPDQAAAST